MRGIGSRCSRSRLSYFQDKQGSAAARVSCFALWHEAAVALVSVTSPRGLVLTLVTKSASKVAAKLQTVASADVRAPGCALAGNGRDRRSILTAPQRLLTIW